MSVDSQSLRQWCHEVDRTGENEFIDDGTKVQCKVKRPSGPDYDPGDNEHIDKFYFGRDWLYISVARNDGHRIKFDFEREVDVDVDGERVSVQTPSTEIDFR